jgi:hypothetical protein
MGSIGRPRQVSNQHASALRANGSVTALVVHAVDAEGVSAAPGGGSTQVSIKEILTSAGASVIDSTVNAIGVTIRAGSLAGTEYTDGDIDATVSGGALLFDNSSNTLRPVTITRGLPVNVVAGAAGGSTEITVRQSTAADFQATITPAGGSTFRTQPGSTAWASSAGFHFDSSGAMTVREQAPSTGPFVISSIVGVVTVSTGPSLVRLTDRDQSTQVAAILGAVPASTAYGLVTRDLSTGPFAVSSVGGIVTVSTGPFAVSSIAGVSRFAANNVADGIVHVGDSTNAAIRVNVVAGAAGGSTQVSIKEFLTSSGGSILDGTNVAMRVNVVAGAAGGSTEATVRQSTYTDFNTLSRLADRDASTQVAAILGSAPASTSYGLVTRDLSTGPYAISSVGGIVTISTGPFVISSVGGVVAISTGPYSISSVAGVVTISTGPYSISSIVGVSIVRPEAGSTWTTKSLTFDSTGGGVIGSTKAINVGANGLLVRQGSVDSTFASAQAASSGDVTVLTSAATQIYVFAVSLAVASTLVAVKSRFLSGSTTLLWQTVIGSAVSTSASYPIVPYTISVPPPAYLFRTAAGAALVLNATSSGVNYAVSAWRE